MKNPFKALWNWAKRSAIESALRKYLTRETIAKCAAEAINGLILSRLSRFDEADVARVAQRCAQVAIVAAEIADAVKDKQITQDEIFAITAKVEDLTGALLSQENLDGLIAKIMEKLA